MLRIVTSNNPGIIEHLESPRLDKLGIDYVAAEHVSALDELIRTKQPNLAILDRDIRGGSGIQLCRQIRDDLGLNEVRVLVVLPSVIERSDLEALNHSRCDDVLTVPVSEDDFFHHLVSLSGRTYRRNDRVAVELEMRIDHAGSTTSAMAVDLSLGGVGVRLQDPLVEGATVQIRMIHLGSELPAASGRVAWQREIAGGHLAGLSFGEVPIETRFAIEELCLFEVVASPLGGMRAYIHGDIIETTNLEPLAERLADANPIEINLREVRFLSSAGTRHWVELLRGLRGKRYWFRHASSSFVNVACIVPMALGEGEMLSFEAPYHCEHCERDDSRLLSTAALIRDGDEVAPPTLRCPVCGGELLFDELPWRYFAFLRGT